MRHINNKIRYIIFILFIIIFNMSYCYATSRNIKRVLNHGQRWRILYYQAGPYELYTKNLYHIIEALYSTGWITLPYSTTIETSQADILWKWCIEHAGKSGYIEFLKNGYYDGDWNDEKNDKIQQEIINRCNNKKDVDLIIAAGTQAGKRMANNLHHTNVMVISSTDPVAAGIIYSMYDSGFNHVHARTNYQLYYSQLLVFDAIIPLHNLGIIYEDSYIGRSYTGFSELMLAKRDLGFDTVSCFANDITAAGSVERAEKEYIDCLIKIIPKIDAFYLTAHGGITVHQLPIIANMLKKHNIPSFTQMGGDDIKNGILMGVIDMDRRMIGRYYVDVMAQMFNGILPRCINQIYNNPLKIEINVTTAKKMTTPIDIRALEILERVMITITKDEKEGK